MATYYSSFYSTTSATRGTTAATAKDTIPQQQNVGVFRGNKQTLTAYAQALPTTSDFVVLMTLNSGVRISGIWMNDDNASAAGAMNLGLYNAGTTTAVVTNAGTLFASALAKNTNHTEAFTQATRLKSVHRFLQLWELINVLAASTYSANPNLFYDLILVPSTTFTTTASQFLVEVDIQEQ